MLLPIIPAILLIAVLAGVSSIQTAHAAPVGLVCLNDAAGAAAPPANPCAAAPITFDGPNPSTPQISPTQIRVGVYINGSDALNGFDVSLLVSHLFLTPAGFDLTGSVLPTPTTIILECRQNVLIQGSVCAPTDSIDTYHLVVVGKLGATTNPPTSGLLFTAIYNVVGTTTASGIPVGFQTGCTGTSVAGGVCVTISNGSTAPVPETVQSGTLFTNSVNPPFVAITSNAVNGNVTAIKGGVSPTVTITATAEGGFPTGTGCGGFGCAVDSVAFSADVPGGFTAPTFSLASCATAGTNCSTVATINTGTAGTYTITVYGTYVSDSGTIGITLRGPVKITVNIQDVGYTVNGAAFAGTQTAFTAKQGGSPLFFVTAQSLGQYTGTISYTITLGSQGTTGLTLASYIVPAAFTLPAGSTITKAVNVTAATNEGLAQIKINQVTTPSVGAHASGILSIRVSGFSVVTNATSVSFNGGGSATVSDTWTSLGNPAATNGFAGALAISNTITGPTGTGQLSATCTTPVTLVAGGAAAGTCSFSGTLAGSYTVTIAGTGGTNNDMTNSTNVSVTIVPVGPPPGINLSASPTSVTANVGATGGTSTITVASRGGFTGTVNLSVTSTGSATCLLSPTSVVLGTSGTSTLTCSSSTAQTDTATVTATSGSTTNSTSVTFVFRDFTIAASSPAAVNAGQSAVSTITIAAVNGFSGVVTLTDTVPAGLTCGAITPGSVTGSGTATVSCSATVAGNYVLTVTGTSGSLVHTATA